MRALTLLENTDRLGGNLSVKKKVFCLPKVLQAGLGAGGHRPWAVSRSEKNPAGVR